MDQEIKNLSKKIQRIIVKLKWIKQDTYSINMNENNVH